MDENKQDLTFWHTNNPSALASVENTLPGLLRTGKGLEIKCGSSFLCEKLGLTQLILPMRIAGKPKNQDNPGAGEIVEANSSLEALQLDFVFICYGDILTPELQRIFREAYRILKTNGVLVLVFFDPNSHAAETFFRQETRTNGTSTAEQIIFELSNCGFKQFDFMQTLFKPVQKMREVQEPKTGYGEGLFVVVQARKQI